MNKASSIVDHLLDEWTELAFEEINGSRDMADEESKVNWELDLDRALAAVRLYQVCISPSLMAMTD